MDKGTLALKVGEEAMLEAIISPDNVSNRAVTWRSSDNAVATVNNIGSVTAKAAGLATITATTMDGGFTASCAVTGTAVPVTGVILNKETLTLNVGEEEILAATISPDNATDKTVAWSSSAPEVAAVDEATGAITAIARGEATITAITNDGGKTAACAVTVMQPVTSVKLNKETLSLNVGEEETLVATVLPDNANNRTVIFSSNNSAVATVDEATGVVTAIAQGKATITATTQDGSKIATCAVTVTQPVTGVELNKETLSLNVGASETLTATVLPTNATDKSIAWSSSTPTVATVNTATGLVTAVSSGEATITVTTADGSKTANLRRNRNAVRNKRRHQQRYAYAEGGRRSNTHSNG